MVSRCCIAEPAAWKRDRTWRERSPKSGHLQGKASFWQNSGSQGSGLAFGLRVFSFSLGFRALGFRVLTVGLDGTGFPVPVLLTWDFPKIGIPYFGVLIIRILLFRVLY